MTVADTSIDAYRSLTVGDLSKGQAAVMRVIGERLDYTRAEIAALAGIPLQSVCGRVNELVAAGLLENGPRRLCSKTGNAAKPLRLPKKQTELI